MPCRTPGINGSTSFAERRQQGFVPSRKHRASYKSRCPASWEKTRSKLKSCLKNAEALSAPGPGAPGASCPLPASARRCCGLPGPPWQLLGAPQKRCKKKIGFRDFSGQRQPRIQQASAGFRPVEYGEGGMAMAVQSALGPLGRRLLGRTYSAEHTNTSAQLLSFRKTSCVAELPESRLDQVLERADLQAQKVRAHTPCPSSLQTRLSASLTL